MPVYVNVGMGVGAIPVFDTLSGLFTISMDLQKELKLSSVLPNCWTSKSSRYQNLLRGQGCKE